jgi:superfamily II DNA helicase RecQ
MTKVTNLETAVSIVRTSTDKATALADIMNILGVSRSNAFVYHTKASKILFSANNVDEVMAKVSPKYKKVSESVQGTSSTKKAQKLAEIDAFLASNAASSKGNPFAALGA